MFCLGDNGVCMGMLRSGEVLTGGGAFYQFNDYGKQNS